MHCLAIRMNILLFHFILIYRSFSIWCRSFSSNSSEETRIFICVFLLPRNISLWRSEDDQLRTPCVFTFRHFVCGQQLHAKHQKDLSCHFRSDASTAGRVYCVRARVRVKVIHPCVIPMKWKANAVKTLSLGALDFYCWLRWMWLVLTCIWYPSSVWRTMRTFECTVPCIQFDRLSHLHPSIFIPFASMSSPSHIDVHNRFGYSFSEENLTKAESNAAKKIPNPLLAELERFVCRCDCNINDFRRKHQPRARRGTEKFRRRVIKYYRLLSSCGFFCAYQFSGVKWRDMNK